MPELAPKLPPRVNRRRHHRHATFLLAGTVSCGNLPIIGNHSLRDRSQAMRNALEPAAGGRYCFLITDDDLAAVSHLSVGVSLKQPDFAGLDNLQWLDLRATRARYSQLSTPTPTWIVGDAELCARSAAHSRQFPRYPNPYNAGALRVATTRRRSAPRSPGGARPGAQSPHCPNAVADTRRPAGGGNAPACPRCTAGKRC